MTIFVNEATRNRKVSPEKKSPAFDAKFQIGFLPSLVVCPIWPVNQTVYCRESIRLSKAACKIS